MYVSRQFQTRSPIVEGGDGPILPHMCWFTGFKQTDRRVQPFEITGGPDTIRTCDLRLRRATLYPTELRVQRTPNPKGRCAFLYRHSPRTSIFRCEASPRAIGAPGPPPVPPSVRLARRQPRADGPADSPDPSSNSPFPDFDCRTWALLAAVPLAGNRSCPGQAVPTNNRVRSTVSRPRPSASAGSSLCSQRSSRPPPWRSARARNRSAAAALPERSSSSPLSYALKVNEPLPRRRFAATPRRRYGPPPPGVPVPWQNAGRREIPSG
jgi:hypothetical protein